MATIKRGKPAKDAEKQAETAKGSNVEARHEVVNNPIEPEIKDVTPEPPKRTEPIITVLQPKPAQPQLSQPSRVAAGNVTLYHKKSGRSLSVARSFAQQLLKNNKDYEIK